MLGKIKWFDQRRGYGFIIGDDDNLEYFFHYSAIISSDDYKVLLQDQKISFDVDESEKGLKAKNVRKMG